MELYGCLLNCGPSVALDLRIYGVPNAQDALQSCSFGVVRPHCDPGCLSIDRRNPRFVSVNQKEARHERHSRCKPRLACVVLSRISKAPAGAEARLKALNITLPPDAAPAANFVNSVQTGKGKLGKDLTVEQGREAARQAGLIMLTKIRTALGSLDRVKRVVKVLGMVNSAEGFGDQPLVVNGFSDLMVEVFGEAGKHARSAVGMAGLPGNSPIEVESKRPSSIRLDRQCTSPEPSLAHPSIARQKSIHFQALSSPNVVTRVT
jgi:enamine deaminase RidA (YjgF/YER057c/UK114 family)